MSYEQQFLDALKSIFIGAKVEGDSGYINLMKIKANYFENGVFPQLMKDIDSACKPFEKGFREELFDKLYDFFRHYFSESGSIYFRNTAQHHNIYEKVYTDDRDVMLFWKTHMLYYVKTDRLFKSMDVEVDGENFSFDVSGMELKRSNEKRELTYAFKVIKDGKTILTVAYSEKGRKTKIDEIIAAVKAKGMTLAEETFEKALRVFEKQSEVDYFINKNAKAFLQEQFDLWMYQYIFKGESDFNETRLKQLQAIKAIATKIIDFIAQFEDELVRVWNKPKFALNSNYIITLDKIAQVDETLLKKIFNHKGIKAQMAEWRELGIINEQFNLETVMQKDLLGELLLPQYQYLPLDTKYFKDLKLDILALFDDLDSALDGWLIHSENYQALNTILPKFRERVQVSFIDPPYNTGGDEFIYEDKFRHSSWASMIHNRLELAAQLLKQNGSLWITLDDKEAANCRQVGEQILGSENFVSLVAWQKVYSPRMDAKQFSSSFDSILVFSRSGNWKPNQLTIEPDLEQFSHTDKEGRRYRSDPLRKWGKNSARKDRPNLWYPIESPEGKKVYPIKPDGTEGCWRWGETTTLENYDRLDWLDKGNGLQPYVRQYADESTSRPPETLWLYEDVGSTHESQEEIKSLFAQLKYFTPKPTRLVEHAFNIAANTDDIIIDFFAGSGTTANAVINLNRNDGKKRKYILVEMGDYFDTVILPRIKKVIFSDLWKSGEAQAGTGISHFAKYFELEQYEESLRRARYEDAPLFVGTQDAYSDYVFLRDLKLLDAVKVDTKKDKIEVNLGKLYDGIDLAETLSCLTGKWIKRITKDTVEFQDGTSANLSNPDWGDIKPLIWW